MQEGRNVVMARLRPEPSELSAVGVGGGTAPSSDKEVGPFHLSPPLRHLLCTLLWEGGTTPSHYQKDGSRSSESSEL